MKKHYIFSFIIAFFFQTTTIYAYSITDFVFKKKTKTEVSNTKKQKSYPITNKKKEQKSKKNYYDVECDTYSQTIDPPLEIGPNVGSISLILTATNNVEITDVNVTINLNHSFTGDLEISLIAPNGTEIDLSSNNGGGGNNYTNTVFDDAATQSITTGSAPFTGAYIPEESLSTFNSLSSIGDWTLSINDSSNGDGGELLDWSLEICGNEISDVSCESYSQTNTPPLEIGPNISTTTATINASVNVEITDVNVTINLNHTFTNDLEISLIAPNGTDIDLSSHNGGSNNNYTNTVFDDAASQSITSGSAPFTGTFSPEESLSAFNNLTSLGNWTLSIIDTSNGDGGELLNWSLDICGHIVLDTAPITFDQAIKVFPNPTSDFIKINSENPIKVYISSIIGKLLSVNNFDTGINQIDLSSYENGVYLVKVETINEISKSTHAYKILKTD